jgi:hypothetical protein
LLRDNRLSLRTYCNLLPKGKYSLREVVDSLREVFASLREVFASLREGVGSLREGIASLRVSISRGFTGTEENFAYAEQVVGCP